MDSYRNMRRVCSGVCLILLDCQKRHTPYACSLRPSENGETAFCDMHVERFEQ